MCCGRRCAGCRAYWKKRSLNDEGTIWATAVFRCIWVERHFLLD